MRRREILLLAALAIAAGALVMAQRPAAPAVGPPAAVSAERGPSALGRPDAPVDPAEIRDVFRFAERPSTVKARPAARAAPLLAGPSPSPELPRLVGLVRRGGRLLAAFAVDGDVVLAGPGETAAGMTVLEVSEEGVLVRRKDGSEERLLLP